MTYQKYLIALLLCSSQAVSASNFSYTGSFSTDSDVQFFDFTLTFDSTSFIINTLSFNGGLNLAGDKIAGGGFNPYLSLWDQSTGAWVSDTLGKQIADEAMISSIGTLKAGNYILALTQYDNVVLGSYLSDGFAADQGLATFGATPFTGNGGGGSGHWAVDIANVNTSSVANIPIPGAFSLLLSGLLALGPLSLRKLTA